MALIKPEGMFGGERIRACSDEAQLHWPRFLVLSNSYARFEVDYEKLVNVAYAGFKVKPTQDRLMGFLKEYNDNFLLFIYTANDGSLWAEWVTEKENLLKYHTKADNESPAPAPDALAAFRRAYVDRKKSKSSKLFEMNKRLKPFEILSIHFNESLRVGVESGVETGVGDGEGCALDLLDGETGDTPETPLPPDSGSESIPGDLKRDVVPGTKKRSVPVSKSSKFDPGSYAKPIGTNSAEYVHAVCGFHWSSQSDMYWVGKILTEKELIAKFDRLAGQYEGHMLRNKTVKQVPNKKEWQNYRTPGGFDNDANTL